MQTYKFTEVIFSVVYKKLEMVMHATTKQCNGHSRFGCSSNWIFCV